MPNATVTLDLTDRIDLKSCPGGYVRLRQLPFGKKLDRRDNATRLSMEQAAREGKGNKEADARLYIESLNRWSRAFDFEHCIGEHNLEDSKGSLLDFSNPMTLDILDPRIGSELEKLIDDLNGEEDDESLEDFMRQHATSSQEETPSALDGQ